MKIFFCFLSSFFLFFSLPVNGAQWIYSGNGYGQFPLPVNNNLISWSLEGAFNQIGPLSSETYIAYNANSTGCSGPNGWCPVGVKFANFSFSGGVIQFKSGNLPIGATKGSKCYITSITGISGSTGGTGSDIRQNKVFSNTQYVVNDTDWIAVDGACSDLTPNSPSISQLSIIVPEISGYIPMLVSGTTLAPRESSIIEGGDVFTEQRGFTSTAYLRPTSRIIACSEPIYSKATCSASFFALTLNSIGPNIPDVICNVSVPREITISDVSTNDFIGKKGSDTIYAQCSLPATLSFQMSNNGTVKVGPFNVTTLIDNQSSPKIMIPENGKDINISAEIKGNSETVEAGSYENSVVIIMSIS
ncbi:hypothetical protein AB7X06_22405 [Providencia rettgeri]